MPKFYSKEFLNLRTLEHLALRLSVPIEELVKVADSVETSYRKWPKKKPSGGIRWLTSPKRKLKKVQKRINRLLQEISISSAAHCGVKGKSNKTHARLHAGKKVVFQLDIKDFYPSISHYAVFNMFREELRCSKEVAKLLTRLVTYEKSIPQGAPTSTTIANIVCRSLDKRLLGHSARYSLEYSRFNDDFDFSGGKIPNTFQVMARRFVGQYGYQINESKSGVTQASAPQIITGLSVNSKHPRVPKKLRLKWRKEKHLLDKFGRGELPKSVFERRMRALIGKAYYLAYINGKNRNKDTFHGNG